MSDPATPPPIPTAPVVPAVPNVPDQDAIAKAASWVAPLRKEIARVLVGQADLVDRQAQ